ncbi:hypothetical protein C0V70_04175 [Bacteriovorax stolpii]|uniref:Transposase IS200-like domain-containing protein n=3 Tax=Bacteriovorax stolpii TaxID=960 RepID=A0A2K9NP69_BACTC|nr:hypothetical protein C0V70_04175 [Bacteriovorax stolpii]
MPLMWRLTKESLKEAYAIHPVELISFVLMTNHYHMILVTPEGNLDEFIYEFNKRLALKVQKVSGRINQVFGGRYKWCLIQSQNYFMNCYRYVYQNPVRAGISRDCQSYPYSTIHHLIGKGSFVIPIHDRYGFKDEYGLNWINSEIAEKEKEILRKGLYRSLFS